MYCEQLPVNLYGAISMAIKSYGLVIGMGKVIKTICALREWWKLDSTENEQTDCFSSNLLDS